MPSNADTAEGGRNDEEKLKARTGSIIVMQKVAQCHSITHEAIEENMPTFQSIGRCP